MRLNGRRESSNVEDRRGVSGGVGTKAGLGIGGIILIAVVTFLSGGNIGDVVTNVIQNVGTEALQPAPSSNQQFSAEEEELAGFMRPHKVEDESND